MHENYEMKDHQDAKISALFCGDKMHEFYDRLGIPAYLLVSPLHDKIGTSVDRDANEWKVRPGNT